MGNSRRSRNDYCKMRTPSDSDGGVAEDEEACSWKVGREEGWDCSH